MRISLEMVVVNSRLLGKEPEKATARGEVAFDNDLKLEWSEELLPEELEYLRDGLADLISRVRERVITAIAGAQESEGGR